MGILGTFKKSGYPYGGEPIFLSGEQYIGVYRQHLGKGDTTNKTCSSQWATILKGLQERSALFGGWESDNIDNLGQGASLLGRKAPFGGFARVGGKQYAS